MPKIVAKKIDWIKHGYILFSKHGVTGINVDEMSKKLKCNRSSFYWHFKTKKEFIEQLIEYWISIGTDQVIEKTNKNKSASHKLKSLIDISYKKMLSLDFVFYLKRYAQNHKNIKFIIDQIDIKRIEYVKSLLIGMGYNDSVAGLKATVLYKHLLGYHHLNRYKKQDKNHMSEIKKEIKQFIDFRELN